MVKQILSFSRHSERDRQNVMLQTVINEVLKLLQSTLPATIEIMRTISEDCPPIWADSTQIHQVLMNLCTNAYHAFRGAGGIIEIGLKKILVSSGQLLDLPAGAYAQLTVRDNGVGMDGATRDRIFDPYFTTKKPGEGTGLGLATVLGIVKSHGGAISVQSRVGMGSTFNVYFPVSQCAAPGVNARTASQTCIGGCERILLVDDEVPITKAGKRILERLGYSVTGCNNSLEALEIFRSSPAAFDIVITDQTMPRLTGVELARALLEIRPDIPVVLCTGYSECVDEHTASTAGIRQFLMKPVSRETLTHTIRKLFVENK